MSNNIVLFGKGVNEQLKNYSKRKPCHALYCIAHFKERKDNTFYKVGFSINFITRLANYKTFQPFGLYIYALIIFDEKKVIKDIPENMEKKDKTKKRIAWMLTKEKELHKLLQPYYYLEAQETSGARETYRGKYINEILAKFKIIEDKYKDDVLESNYKPFVSHIYAPITKNADGIDIEDIEEVRKEIERKQNIKIVDIAETIHKQLMNKRDKVSTRYSQRTRQPIIYKENFYETIEKALKKKI